MLLVHFSVHLIHLGVSLGLLSKQILVAKHRYSTDMLCPCIGYVYNIRVYSVCIMVRIFNETLASTYDYVQKYQLHLLSNA